MVRPNQRESIEASRPGGRFGISVLGAVLGVLIGLLVGLCWSATLAGGQGRGQVC